MTDVTEEMDSEFTTKKGIWEQVPHMFGPAPVCTACGQVPKDDHGAGPLPAYNAVGVDVDWGNHLFICWTCAGILAELHGCDTAENTEKRKKQLRLLKEKNEALTTQLAEQQEKIDTIVAGARARKELKNG